MLHSNDPVLAPIAGADHREILFSPVESRDACLVIGTPFDSG